MSLLDLILEKPTATRVAGRIFGAVIGVVSNVDDPDRLGRVKVALSVAQGRQREPVGARSCRSWPDPAAAPCSGPRRGDEVLVLFDHGDMRFPYVIGGAVERQGRDAERAGRRWRQCRSPDQVAQRTSDPPRRHRRRRESHGARQGWATSIELSSDGHRHQEQRGQNRQRGAAQGLVLGDALMHSVQHPYPPDRRRPSGPPVQPMVAGTHVSTKHKTE